MRSSAFVLAALLLGLAPAPSGPRLLPAADLRPDPTFRLPDSVRAQLSQVAELALDPDGSLYLADYRFPAVLHLEADGRLRRILGRAGSGPGEFSYIFQLGVTRDTLWASDPGLGRVTLFPRDGKGVRTIGYGFAYSGRPRDDVPQLRRGVVVAVLPSGDFIAGAEVKPAGNPEGEPIAYAALRVDRDNVVRDTIAVISPEKRDAPVLLPRRRHHAAPALQRHLVPGVCQRRLAAGAGGPARGAARRGRGHVHGHRVAGRGVAPAVAPGGVVPAGADHQRADREGVGAVRPSGSGRAANAHHRRLHPRAPLPAADAAAVTPQPVVGRDGHIWLQVQLADSPPDRAEWMLLSPNGYPIRRVTTDARFRLLEADRTTLWGVIDDRDDVPQVVRYRVPPLAS
ncbi:MAG: hypothetical protein IPF77_13280 [Gemmatimonadetes bacterium]|nr:hypothetical protein [Gemmatimonadota bacterium]